MQSINPYTNKLIANYKEFSDEEIEEKLTNSSIAFKKWKSIEFKKKSHLLKNLAAILLRDKLNLATIITNETGKPINQSMSEIVKCSWICRFYANKSEDVLQNKIIETEATKSYVKYEPLGVVLAIMPWNYPFWQYFRFIAPNLMAGNVGVLKHASNVSGCALAIENIFIEAGFPKDVSSTFLVKGENTYKLIENEIVKAVSFTGSFKAGSKVAELSAKHIKKTVLELGGNNALIVFNDADIDKTLEIVVSSRFQNSGQSCIAGKRLFLHENIYQEFTEKLQETVTKLRFTDPHRIDAEIGVLAKEEFAIELENQMKKSIEKGAKILVGGKRDGSFFEPTVLMNVKSDMEVFKEETFGPLLAITEFTTDDEAIHLSNKSDFGLGVSIFTKDENRINKMINELDESAVFVNELVKSDPRLPFGGIKKSGYGRELSSDALFEFVNVKTIYIR